jgi:predicted lipoprotein
MKKSFYFLLSATLLLGACKKKKPDPDQPEEDAYDQKSMFENYSGNLIIPAYNALVVKADSLTLKIQDFNASPTLPNLLAVRTAYISAYKQFTHVSTYEFGPAGSIFFRTSSNVFPTDTTQINTNIGTGVYDLNASEQADAIGFPGMDFLLFGYNKTDIYVLNLFITSSNRRQYLADINAHFKQQLTTVHNGWSTYAGTFNNATGNSAGSSLSYLVNQLNFDFEISKNARLGIPLGKQTLGVALPNKCEALYSHNSLILINEHVKALENIYLGRSQGGSDGNGLDDYLEFLGKTSLNSSIKTKFGELKTLLAVIPGPLSVTVTSAPANAESAYAKFQELLVLLKTDMPSALSVAITYADGDGD